jgi:nitroreductase
MNSSMPQLDLTPEQLLTTTRSVRKRLDFSRPVEMEVLRECIGIAMQAPSGSNTQPWSFIIVTDSEKRRAIAELYRSAFKIHLQSAEPIIRQTFEEKGHGQQIQRINESSEYLAEYLHEVPCFVIPCLKGGSNPMSPPRLEHAPNFVTCAWLGSTLPAVWSFMLAARLYGLGTSWTTLHLVYEKEVAGLLGIPYDHITQVALIPVAYTRGTEFKPAPRKPVSEVFHINSW